MGSTGMALDNGRACIMIISGNVLRRLRIVIIRIPKIMFSSNVFEFVWSFCVGGVIENSDLPRILSG